MRFQVFQTDIDAGSRNKCTHCPVALAIRRRLSDSRRVSVNGNIYIGGSAYPMPDSVNDFVRRFDSKLPVAPFEFHLRVNKR